MCDGHNFHDLATCGVRGLQPYQPGKPIEALERELGIVDSVKLASNENPLGPGPKALAAARAARAEVGRYPDGGGYRLKAALAEHHRVSSAHLTLGNGSNDVLDLIARTFLGPGRSAVFSEYCFALYPLLVQAVGAQGLVTAAHDGASGPAYGHDLVAMAHIIRADTRVAFIANPNNPTGTWVAAEPLEAFLRAVPSTLIVVVDEAYFEYVEEVSYPDCSRWLERFPNLLVTRTFSKVHGLAGLRIGYALSHPCVAELLNRARQPFNVNTIALAAAEAALSDGEHITASVENNRAGYAQLCAGLRTLGLSHLPSVANFVTFDVGCSALGVYEALLRRGVIVRPLSAQGLNRHLRATVGTSEQNQRLLAALAAVLAARATR